MPGCKRKGRCHGKRWVSQLPDNYIEHLAHQRLEPNSVCLTIEDIEIIRIIDLENLTQQEAAARLGVSRKTLWNDLQRSRRKSLMHTFMAIPYVL